MGRENSGCPTCQSADTISIEATLVRDTRYCYGCRRSFDMELSGPPEKAAPARGPVERLNFRAAAMTRAC